MKSPFDWAEYHYYSVATWYLTFKGWVCSSRTVNGCGVVDARPDNWVLIYEITEKQKSPESEVEKTVDAIWKSIDDKLIDKLKVQYGEYPRDTNLSTIHPLTHF